jgi:hypothetical protein
MTNDYRQYLTANLEAARSLKLHANEQYKLAVDDRVKRRYWDGQALYWEQRVSYWESRLREQDDEPLPHS